MIGVVDDVAGAVGGAKATNTEAWAIRSDLIDGLPAGTRITPENVVGIRKLPDGRTVWLETGNDAAGLQHIYRRHGTDLANKEIPREQVPAVVMDELKQGNVVGTNGSASVCRIVHNGTEQHIAMGVGSNELVVRANPVSQWRPLPQPHFASQMNFSHPPIFCPVPDRMGHVAIDELPVSDSLKFALMAWDAAYQSIYNDSYPPDSGFHSSELQDAHRKRGAELADLPQAELGDMFRIEYQC